MPTKISWTDETWNPVVGCSKCSPGCQNCYAERMAWRLANMEICGYKKVVSDIGWRGNVECLPDQLNKPLHWKKPRRIFVCSMGDLFHPAVPFEFILKVWKIMFRCSQHTFLVLTKKVKQMDAFTKWLFIEKEYRPNSPNIHLGISISTQAEADEKIPILLQIPAAVRFVSCEPLLGEIDLHLSDSRKDILWRRTHGGSYQREFIHWVIIGCESINGRAGRYDGEFVYAAKQIVRQCKAANVPVFVKQIPAVGGKVSKNMAEWPEELRVQEMPE